MKRTSIYWVIAMVVVLVSFFIGCNCVQFDTEAPQKTTMRELSKGKSSIGKLSTGMITGSVFEMWGLDE